MSSIINSTNGSWAWPIFLHSKSQFHLNIYVSLDYACLVPPIPPEDTNLERVWDYIPVNMTDDVEYKCKRGMKLDTGILDTPQRLTCQAGNTWDEPATDNDWEQCVESECPNFKRSSFYMCQKNKNWQNALLNTKRNYYSLL